MQLFLMSPQVWLSTVERLTADDRKRLSLNVTVTVGGTGFHDRRHVRGNCWLTVPVCCLVTDRDASELARHGWLADDRSGHVANGLCSCKVSVDVKHKQGAERLR